MLPSSDARGFKKQLEMLDGQTFLLAFDRLRGAGAISEIEGTRATNAINALKDTGISKEEYRKNMEILTDIVKSGINTQRQTVGLAPKYKLSQEIRDERARDWLRENPNHPKADEVRRRLEGK